MLFKLDYIKNHGRYYWILLCISSALKNTFTFFFPTSRELWMNFFVLRNGSKGSLSYVFGCSLSHFCCKVEVIAIFGSEDITIFSEGKKKSLINEKKQ